jgi:hypothetical protein
MNKAAEPQEILPNEDAKKISQLMLQHENIHTPLSIDDVGLIMNKAKQHTKLPAKVAAKMSVGNLLSELGGLMTPNQSYAYYHLPKALRAGA